MEKNLLIIATDHYTTQGVELEFNMPVALNGVMPCKKWFVTWDRIGKALTKEYCDKSDVEGLRELRDKSSQE